MFKKRGSPLAANSTWSVQLHECLILARRANFGWHRDKATKGANSFQRHVLLLGVVLQLKFKQPSGEESWSCFAQGKCQQNGVFLNFFRVHSDVCKLWAKNVKQNESSAPGHSRTGSYVRFYAPELWSPSTVRTLCSSIMGPKQPRTATATSAKQ